MRGFVLDSDIENKSVPVNSKFINSYMIRANGEYVKVYLMLLYYSSIGNSEMSLELLGDSLEQNEKAVIRALKYWEQMNLLTLKYGENDDICGVTIKSFDSGDGGRTAATREEIPDRSGTGSKTAKQQKIYIKQPVVSEAKACPDKKPDLRRVDNDEDFAALIVAVQQYLGMTLSKKNLESLTYVYDVLGFSLELIEYIVEICVNAGYKSIDYMEKVARSWYNRGIVTLEQAKIYGVVCHKDTYKVMEALGLKGRSPGLVEQEWIDRWFREYGFSLNIVIEACNRTIVQIHQPDFKYVDGILKSWSEAGVKSMGDVKKLDEEHVKEKQKPDNRDARPAESRKGYTPKQNKFHNFEQRDVDYEDMKIDISVY